MDEDTKEKIRSRNIQHLKTLAENYSSTCPSLSNLYRLKTLDIQRHQLGFSLKHTKKACPYCGSVYSGDNYSIRFKPRQKMTKKLRQLLNRYAKNPSALGKYQSSLVHAYLYSSNVMIKRCKVCNKQNKIPCQSQFERSVQVELSKKSSETEAKIKTGKERKKDKKKQRRKLMEQSNASISTPRNQKSTTKSSISSSTSMDRPSSNSSSLFKETPDLFGGKSSTPHGNRFSSSQDSTGTSSSLKTASASYSCEKSSSTRDVSQSFRKPILANQTAPIMSLLSNKSSQSPESKSTKKRKMKNMHQQLNKMLEKEKKKDSQSGSLSDFLSSL